MREPEEFNAGAIEGAVNYPRGMLEVKIYQHPLAYDCADTALALEHLNQYAIYLICSTGGRSALAAEALKDMGFKQVHSVQGGYQVWLEAGMQ